MNNKNSVTILDSEPITEEPISVNVERLEKIAAHIESHGEAFHMQWWCHSERTRPTLLQRFFGQEGEICGTTYCIAGWTIKLFGGSMCDNIPAQAQKLLGLTFDQATRLFYS